VRFVLRILAELPATGGRVGLLGLSFKADTDDLRGSPAIYVARRLLEEGHDVITPAPAVGPDRAVEAAPGLETVATAAETFADADAVVIATEWKAFADLPLEALGGTMRGRLFFDGRCLIKPSVATAAGLHYRGVGRRSHSPAPVAAS